MSFSPQLSRFALLGLFTLGLQPTGCAPTLESPGTHPALVTLVSPCESPEFDLGFWTEQAENSSSVWVKALSFCTQHPDRPLPNCRLVLSVNSAQAAVTIPIRRGSTELLFHQPSVAEPFLPPEVSIEEDTP